MTVMPYRAQLRCLLVALCLVLGVLPGLARAQMPDLAQMSGVPLPTGEMPDGTVSVRVVRDTLGNNQTGVTVTLTGDGVSASAVTDAEGRAIFSGLPAGASIRATATTQGDAASSQPFAVPSQGGVRLILALGLGGGDGASAAPPAATAPAVPGRVVLGTQTRTIVEIMDAGLEVFHVFEIANIAEGPVDVGPPIEFAMPEGAQTVTLLDGSTPQARVFDSKLVIAGPFAPGRTMAQVAYRISHAGPTATVALPVPLPMIQTNLIVRVIGATRVVAPVLQQSRTAEVEGRTYWTGTGPGLGAGDTLTIRLEGLPFHPRWPRYTALTVAGLIVLVGIWLAFVRPVDPTQRIAELDARRRQLLDEVQGLGEGADARRAVLMDELEGVYAMLDAERGREGLAGRPPAGRRS